MGMILGTVIIGTTSSIVSGGLAVILVSAVLGFGAGGVFGSYVKKKYKDVYLKLTLLERASLKAVLMMKAFASIKAQYDKNILLHLLERICYEGKKIIILSDETNSTVLE